MQPAPKGSNWGKKNPRDNRLVVDPRPPKGGGTSFIQPIGNARPGKIGTNPPRQRNAGGIMQPTVNKVYKTY